MTKKMPNMKMHHDFAVTTHNAIWPILDKEQPSEEELEEAMHMAHASRYHWSKAGTPINIARAEYMISRVYCAMGRAEPALFHAERCLELTQESKKTDDNFQDWDVPFAHEVLARAHSVAGNKDECDKYRVMAQTETDELDADEDKKLVQGELDKVQC
ncbi:hypothetical protein EU546_07730 [Candidatus Thorarchaeota archaeon]|nr:MAG: hypothetical protein EU546_07730 [Candidatus Thorarchaeota archaeon]